MPKATASQNPDHPVSDFVKAHTDLAYDVPAPQGQVASLLETTNALIGIYDPCDRLVFANREFREAFHVEDHELILWPDMMRRNFALNRGTILKTDDIEVWITSVESRRGKIANRTFETDLHDGRWIWAQETVGPDGFMLFIGQDMTSVRREERELRMDRDYALKASHTDDLTGVSNRRHIMEMLGDVINGATAQSAGGGCACLMDLDHFKKVNDRFGHLAGDKVLSGFARLVRDVVRLADGLGRVGGEEFLLIMPGVTLPEGTEIVQRIFDSLRQSALVPDAAQARITVSAGVTEISPTDTAQEVYRRCDQLLYAAKNGGRNQMRLRLD